MADEFHRHHSLTEMGDLFKLGVVWSFAILPAMADVRVVAWGSGSGTNLPPGLTNVVALANGASHSLALRSDGTLSNVVALAAGNDYSLALRSDGTVMAWGENTWG